MGLRRRFRRGFGKFARYAVPIGGVSYGARRMFGGGGGGDF